MIISDEQIKQIALNIVFDVHQYITEHQEEYEKFVAEEEKRLQSKKELKKNNERKEENYVYDYKEH